VIFRFFQSGEYYNNGMKPKKKHNEIVEICKTALTFIEVESRLGTTTPNTSLRRYIKQNNIPMPMYEGRQAACRISQKSRVLVTEADFCENSKASTGSMKKLLIRTGKTQVCEQCGWCERRPSDGRIPIHLHHKNGDSTDNRRENLEFLCPCCHSLTDNYAGKNKKSKRRREEQEARRLYFSVPKYFCETCGRLGYGEKYCSNECSHLAARKVKWPTKEELAKELETLSWVALGRKYNVSDNAVRKWARHYELIL
jgi:hypothetical protein